MADEDKKDNESVETRKKKNTKEKVYNNTVEINPKLEEAKGKTAVVGWGRMNPITSGHEKLVNKIKEVARKESGYPVIFLTHSQDAKKNPLSYNDKVMLARKAFGNIIQKSNSKTIIQAMQELQKKYSKVILVVGADRIKEFETLLNKYNGKDFTFDSIDVVSAGDRTDPDSDAAKEMTADTMSASVMRKLAAEGDFETFKKGLPSKLKSSAQDVYDMVRGGMKIAEALELDEAVLDRQARRQRAITMRRYKSKIAAARKRAMRKAASSEKLAQRARKKAIKVVRQKVASQQGADYSKLDAAQKMIIDKKVAKRKNVVDRIAKKMLPKVRQAERARRAGKSGRINEEFNMFLEATEVRQDPHIKDRKGTQPAVYHKGLSKSTKEKRDAHFKKGAKMDDDNPAAYKPAPGDAEAKTKESKHTKKYRAMYGEESAPTKRFHELRKKDGTIKLDGRFRAFKKKRMQEESPTQAAEKRLRDQHKSEREDLKREHEREMDAVKTRGLRTTIRKINAEEVEFENDLDLLNMIEEVSKEIYESILLDEKKSEEGLKAKAEKSGMPLSVLKKVYDRGVAAWRTGHRPGTTPQQWGYARVNSFVTKSKGTWGGADKDLAAKVRKEEVDLQEQTIGGFADNLLKDLNKSTGLTYDHPRWGETQADVFELVKQSGRGSRNQKSRGTIIRWGAVNAAYQTGKDRKEIRKIARNLVDKFLKTGKKIDVKSRLFGDPEAAYKFGKIVVLDEGDYLLIFTASKLKNSQNYQLVEEAPELVELNSFFDVNEQFDLSEASIMDKALAAIHKHVMGGIELGDIAYQVSRAKGVDKSGRELEKAYIDKYGEPKKKSVGSGAALRKKYGFKEHLELEEKDPCWKGYRQLGTKKKNGKEVPNCVPEEHGAGDRGTPEVTKRYKKDTPGEINEEFESLMEAKCDLIGIKQIKQFEKFVDRMFEKFGIDFNFTKHFGERMSDSRNTPCITLKELADFIKKIYMKQGKSLKGVAGAEAVIKDIQTDLNIPVAVKYDQRNDEFDVVMKTIMRKKNFMTPNKVIKY